MLSGPTSLIVNAFQMLLLCSSQVMFMKAKLMILKRKLFHEQAILTFFSLQELLELLSSSMSFTLMIKYGTEMS